MDRFEEYGSGFNPDNGSASDASNPQFEFDPSIKVPGVDLNALREKYTRMKRDQGFEQSPAGNNDYDMKVRQDRDDKRAKDERMKEKEGGGDEPPRMAFQSAKLDNLLICGRCDGTGLMKCIYGFQEKQMNCSDCVNGLLEKVKNKFPPKKVEDPGPVESQEEELMLQKQLLGLVREHFGARTSQMQEFLFQTREYGTKDVSPNVYYGHLLECFDSKTKLILPILVRLLKDKDKRLDLLRMQHVELGETF
jgi:hypothetical protein